MQLSTTLNLLEKYGACDRAMKAIHKRLGRDFDRNQSIAITDAWDIPGLELPQDAIWALRATLPEQASFRNRVRVEIAVVCAEHVEHIYAARHPDDVRIRNCNAATRRYLAGEIKIEELRSYRTAAAAAYADAADAAAAAYAAAAAADAADAAADAYAADAAAAYAAAAAADAADAAADAAARKTEREWQSEMVYVILSRRVE